MAAELRILRRELEVVKSKLSVSQSSCLHDVQSQLDISCCRGIDDPVLCDAPALSTEIRRPMGIVLADLVEHAPCLTLPTWEAYNAGVSGNRYSFDSAPHAEYATCKGYKDDNCVPWSCLSPSAAEFVPQLALTSAQIHDRRNATTTKTVFQVQSVCVTDVSPTTLHSKATAESDFGPHQSKTRGPRRENSGAKKRAKVDKRIGHPAASPAPRKRNSSSSPTAISCLRVCGSATSPAPRKLNTTSSPTVSSCLRASGSATSPAPRKRNSSTSPTTCLPVGSSVGPAPGGHQALADSRGFDSKPTSIAKTRLAANMRNPEIVRTVRELVQSFELGREVEAALLLLDVTSLGELLAGEASLRSRLQGFPDREARITKMLWIVNITDEDVCDLMRDGMDILANDFCLAG